jgi:hypothetical protein
VRGGSRPRYELVKRFLHQVHMRLERTRLQLLDIYQTQG